MNNILVATNILVYVIDENSRHYSSAQKLLYDSGAKLYTTMKNISEFLSVVTRGKPPALSVDEALLVLQDFQENFTILYSSLNSFKHFQDLLRKYKPTGLRIHDFEIVSIGITHGVTEIATMNRKDFENVDEIHLAEL